MQFLRIVDGSHEILFYLSDGAGGNALHLSRILNTEQDRPPMPIQKGANRFIDIPAETVSASFELGRNVFTLADQFF